MTENVTRDGNEGQTPQPNEEKQSEPQNSRPLSERLTPTAQLSEIAELLRSGDNDVSQDDVRSDSVDNDSDDDLANSGGSTGAAADTVDDISLTGFAEKLDMAPDEVYKLEVTTRDGEAVSIGKLKDAYVNQATAKQEIADKAEQLTQREGALVSDLQALGILDGMSAIPAQQRQAAVEHLNTMAEREYTKFLNAFPDMKDDAKRIAFDNEVGEWLGSYGVSPGQFPVRTLGLYRLLMDGVRDRAELKQLKKPKPKKPPKSVKSQRSAPRKQAQAAKPGNSIQGQIDAIAGLMKG